MKLTLVAVALTLIAGCTFIPSDNAMRQTVERQRVCDTTPLSSVDGWWAKHKWMAACGGALSQMPAACDAAGTESSPVCMNWAATEIAKQQSQASANAIAGSAGWGALGSAL
jgi:hypothetical protein